MHNTCPRRVHFRRREIDATSSVVVVMLWGGIQYDGWIDVLTINIIGMSRCVRVYNYRVKLNGGNDLGVVG